MYNDSAATFIPPFEIFVVGYNFVFIAFCIISIRAIVAAINIVIVCFADNWQLEFYKSTDNERKMCKIYMKTK